MAPMRPRRFPDHESHHHWSYIFLLVLVFVLPRAFLLRHGFGLDPDAWRVVAVAESMALGGDYTPSRFPGYPVPEHALALFAWLGLRPLAVVTVSVAGIGAVLFFRLCIRLACPQPFLLTAAFVSVPIVVVESTGTLDYTWAMTFLLAATWATITYRFAWAGVFLGLAAGSRLAAGLVVVPVLLHLWHALNVRSALRASLCVVALCGVTALACYWALVAQYGSTFLRFVDAPLRLSAALANATVRVWGLLGLLSLVVLFIASIRGGLFRRTPQLTSDIFLAACVLATVAPFVRLPLEPGYLIPLVPFALLLIGRHSHPFAMSIGCALLLASPYVGSLHDARLGSGSTIQATIAGPVSVNLRLRELQMMRAKELAEAVGENTAYHQIYLGSWAPIARYYAATPRARARMAEIPTHHFGPPMEAVDRPSAFLLTETTYLSTVPAFRLAKPSLTPWQPAAWDRDALLLDARRASPD